jgi:hypothetical protein
MVLFLGAVCGLAVSQEMGVCGGTVLPSVVGVDEMAACSGGKEMGAPELLTLMG